MPTTDQITMLLYEKIDASRFDEAVRKGERLGFLQNVAKDLVAVFRGTVVVPSTTPAEERPRRTREEEPIIRERPRVNVDDGVLFSDI